MLDNKIIKKPSKTKTYPEAAEATATATTTNFPQKFPLPWKILSNVCQTDFDYHIIVWLQAS